MPIAPITVPSESRNAEAFSVVGMISPEALRGFRRAFRVTPRAPTSRKRGHEPSGLVQADEAGQRLLEDFVLAEPQELGDRLVGDEDLALEVGNEHRVRSIGDDEVSVEILHREDLFRRFTFGRTDPASTARPTRRPSTSSAIPKRPKRPAA